MTNKNNSMSGNYNKTIKNNYKYKKNNNKWIKHNNKFLCKILKQHIKIWIPNIKNT